MLTELTWMFIQWVILIIDSISWVSAKVLTVFVIIYAIILIRRMFKTQRVVNPEGRAVLITGCDSGFGNLLALKLNSMGYRVYATVLNGASAHDLIQNSEQKDKIVVYKMDITVDEEVEEVYLKVQNDLRRHNCGLWAVVNNAGYGILAQLEWVDLDEYKRLFEVNVFGMVRVTKTFLPLVKFSKGRIVNLSSILGLMTTTGWGPYCMSKWAVTAFNDTLRREMHKFDVKVSALYPGGYKNTNFFKSVFESCDRIWNQLEDSLKSSYGNQQFYEIWKNWNLKGISSNVNDETDQVVNSMIDAVTNSEPRISYSPNDNKYAIFSFSLLRYMPNLILDRIDSF